MRTFLICISAIGFCLLPGVFHAQEIEYVSSTRFDSPPNIDGIIDKIWYTVSQGPAFQPVRREHQHAKNIRVRSGYCNEAIYFLIELDAAYDRAPIARYVQHDDSLWRDTSFEIFLAPQTTYPEYFHFIGNALDTHYDARGRHGASLYDVHWESRFETYGTYWTIEVAIPFTALGISEVPSTTWLVNIAFNNVTQRALSAVAPVVKSYHEIENFIELRFETNDMGSFDSAQPSFRNFDPDAEKRWSLEKSIFTNPSASADIFARECLRLGLSHREIHAVYDTVRLMPIANPLRPFMLVHLAAQAGRVGQKSLLTSILTDAASHYTADSDLGALLELNRLYVSSSRERNRRGPNALSEEVEQAITIAHRVVENHPQLKAAVYSEIALIYSRSRLPRKILPYITYYLQTSPDSLASTRPALHRSFRLTNVLPTLTSTLLRDSATRDEVVTLLYTWAQKYHDQIDPELAYRLLSSFETLSAHEGWNKLPGLEVIERLSRIYLTNVSPPGADFIRQLANISQTLLQSEAASTWIEKFRLLHDELLLVSDMHGDQHRINAYNDLMLHFISYFAFSGDFPQADRYQIVQSKPYIQQLHPPQRFVLEYLSRRQETNRNREFELFFYSFPFEGTNVQAHLAGSQLWIRISHYNTVGSDTMTFELFEEDVQHIKLLLEDANILGRPPTRDIQREEYVGSEFLFCQMGMDIAIHYIHYRDSVLTQFRSQLTNIWADYIGSQHYSREDRGRYLALHQQLASATDRQSRLIEMQGDIHVKNRRLDLAATRFEDALIHAVSVEDQASLRSKLYLTFSQLSAKRGGKHPESEHYRTRARVYQKLLEVDHPERVLSVEVEKLLSMSSSQSRELYQTWQNAIQPDIKEAAFYAFIVRGYESRSGYSDIPDSVTRQFAESQPQLLSGMPARAGRNLRTSRQVNLASALADSFKSVYPNSRFLDDLYFQIAWLNYRVENTRQLADSYISEFLDSKQDIFIDDPAVEDAHQHARRIIPELGKKSSLREAAHALAFKVKLSMGNQIAGSWLKGLPEPDKRAWMGRQVEYAQTLLANLASSSASYDEQRVRQLKRDGNNEDYFSALDLVFKRKLYSGNTCSLARDYLRSGLAAKRISVEYLTELLNDSTLWRSCLDRRYDVINLSFSELALAGNSSAIVELYQKLDNGLIQYENMPSRIQLIFYRHVVQAFIDTGQIDAAITVLQQAIYTYDDPRLVSMVYELEPIIGSAQANKLLSESLVRVNDPATLGFVLVRAWEQDQIALFEQILSHVDSICVNLDISHYIQFYGRMASSTRRSDLKGQLEIRLRLKLSNRTLTEADEEQINRLFRSGAPRVRRNR